MRGEGGDMYTEMKGTGVKQNAILRGREVIEEEEREGRGGNKGI